MGFKDLLEWEEGIFRGLLALGRGIASTSSPAAATREVARLEDEQRSLCVLAQLLTGEPVRLRPARGVGGVRGADILLPETIDFAPTKEGNREAYRVQTVVAAGVRRITRDRQAPDEHRFEGALAALRVAGEAVELMGRELPNFLQAHDRVAGRALASRAQVDLDRLPELEALLEGARRAALAGSRVWEDAELCGRLVGARTSRRRSPDLPVWGVWFRSADEAPVGSPVGRSESNDEPTSEFEAPPVDGLQRVDQGSEQTEDPVPVATFERAESLDEYRGGARDLDGSDELEAHLDALEQVDLGNLFRGSEGAQSLLKADLELGLEVGDASDEGRKGGIAYDEWDSRRRSYRKDWCTVYPARAVQGDPSWAPRMLHAHRRLVLQLRHRLEAQRAGLRSAPRQLEGEEIDLAAALDDRVQRLAGRGSDPRLYVRRRKRRREFATTVLIDVSMSTDSWVDGRRTLDVAREAALVMGEVASQLDDRFAVLAFASETRNRCLVFEVLGFGESWSQGKLRIAGLKPQGYTRIGPALRHAAAQLARQSAEKRLLLLISDGKPTDYDRYEGRYGIADVRMALREAERCEIHTHALAIDAVARDYLPALFGEGGWHVLAQPDQLVEALTAVYGRMTAR